MEYSELIKYLKVCDQNLQTLHRHLRSNTFFEEHKILGEYYDKMGEFVDEFVELGMANGYSDISIADAIASYPLLPIQDYSRKDAFVYVLKSFNELIKIIEDIKPTLKGHIVSKLEEAQYYLDIEANYKVKRIFEVK